MIIANEEALQKLNSSVRFIEGEVMVNNHSFTAQDALKSINIERIGAEGKFFGFGVCQRLNVHFIDVDRQLEITTADELSVWLGDKDSKNRTTPFFNVSEVHRDELTNELSVTAYDKLYKAKEHKVEELGLEAPYTMRDFAQACADVLEINTIEARNFNEVLFDDLYFHNGANFEGTEDLREALDAVAEATQSIYYVSPTNKLVFVRLDKDGAADLVIDKSKYFKLTSKDSRRLATIIHTNSLGNITSFSTAATGSTQVIRENGFWDLDEDIVDRLETAIENVGGLTINQFELEWRGNYFTEIGDKIEIERKDGSTVVAYILDDVIDYDGGYKQKTRWSYAEEEEEAINPTSLGEALKKTFAKVDKQEKTIELMASEVDANSAEISQLFMNTNSINAAVTNMEKQADEANTQINTLTQKVEAQLTAEEVRLEVRSELENGTAKVTTGKGYALNDEGLTVEDLNPDTNNKLKTTISNNGMTVYSNSKEVLVANDEGVKAKDLHATTYLIIGDNSRLEDWGNRTACFWIGG